MRRTVQQDAAAGPSRARIAGAILTSGEVAAEIICDGVHVHRDMVRMAVSAKGADRVMAITDGVAAAGCLKGGRIARRTNDSRERVRRYLEDGTLAGSVTTMDRVFRFLVNLGSASPFMTPCSSARRRRQTNWDSKTPARSPGARSRTWSSWTAISTVKQTSTPGRTAGAFRVDDLIAGGRRWRRP